jgi:nitrite reductase/ring-hydroxylating ferredoxin subunit
VGTDHSQPTEGPEGFVAAARLDELQDSVPRRVEVNGVRLVLVRRGARVAALNEVCAHLGGPLAEGRVEDGGIVCPWHGSRFGLEDGRVLDGPATAPQPCHETRLRDDGVIEVAVPKSVAR